jgi:hypothetical protein
VAFKIGRRMISAQFLLYRCYCIPFQLGFEDIIGKSKTFRKKELSPTSKDRYRASILSGNKPK